jgi:8-amino-7-oxononanoate synthase
VRSLSSGTEQARFHWDSELARRLAERGDAGLLRRLTAVDRPVEPVVEREGRRLVNLSSNNYLGLAGHPAVSEAMARAARRGAGATASRLVAGTDREVLALEERIAAFDGAEAALLFGSGYLANVGVVSALVGRGDAVFSDRLNHASIIDGVRLSRATVHRYEHGDAEYLETLLERADQAGRRLIVTESVFSMDGDVAPLELIVELAERHGAALVVDEAHAGGVFGPEGQGYVHELGLEGRVDLTIGTFGKAFGVYGAYVSGRRLWIDYLVNACRTFIFTTGLPPAVIGGIDAALDLVREAGHPRSELQARAARFRAGLHELGLGTCGSTTQIVPAVAGENDAALAFARGLEEQGVLGVAIRPPTVPEGTARIRFSLTAAHTDEHLDQALAGVEAAAVATGLSSFDRPSRDRQYPPVRSVRDPR